MAKSRDIGFIHCKALLSKHDKQVQNGLRSIVLNYQTRGSKATSVFGDRAFEPLVEWIRHDLHIDLTTCAADSPVPQAEKTIRFVKERLRYIQCEIPFKKYLKRLTIKMVKRVTVLINLFRRKSGVHDVTQTIIVS